MNRLVSKTAGAFLIQNRPVIPYLLNSRYGLSFAGSLVRAETSLSLDSDTLLSSVAINAAKFDRINSQTGISIAPARTNLFANSTSVTAWAKTRATVSVGATPGPKNGVNADKVQATSASGTHNVLQTVSGLADNTVYALSVYVKAAEYTWVYIHFTDKSNTARGGWVNLADGSLGTSVQTLIDRYVIPLSNGWYRVVLIANSSSGATTPFLTLGLATLNNIQIFSGDASGTYGVYFAFPQLEQGAYPSLPIETSGGTASRSADVATVSLTLPPATGHFKVQVVPQWDGNDSADHVLLDAVGTSTSRNRLLLMKDSANNLILRVFGDTDGGSREVYAAVNATSLPKRTLATVEAQWDRWGHLALYLNGTLLADDRGTGTFKANGTWTRPTTFGTTALLGSATGGGQEFGGLFVSAQAKKNPVRAWAAAGTRQRFPRSSTNLLASNNPTVASSETGYTLTKTAGYDGSVTLTADGSGSIKFPANNGDSAKRGRLVSSRVVVSPSTRYTFDFNMLSSTAKGAIVVTVQEYSAANAFLRNAGGRRIYVSAANNIEDCSFIWKTNSDVGRVQIQVDVDEGDPTADIWLDDFYIGPGISFPVSVTKERATFDSPMIRVDPVGNFTLYENGAWKPWIPIAIYQDPALSDYSKYAENGFNLAMFNSGLVGSLTQVAKNATDATYAPFGMYNAIELSEYFDARNVKYQNTADMISKMPTLLAHAAADHILFGYLDVETYTAGNVGVLVFDDVTNIIALWRTYDQSRPLILNGGMEGQGRYFGPFVEGMMSYGSNRQNTGLSHNNGYGVTRPYSFTILSPTDSSNNVVLSAADYKQQFWRAFYEGTRGIAVYKDQPVATGQNLDNASFSDLWAMMKLMADEINNPAILPIVRTPDHASFAAIPADAGLLVGPRDYNGKGHLIIVNDTASDITTDITLAGLTYSPANAVDLFAVDSDVAITGGTTLGLTVAAQDRKVLRLD